MCSMRVLFTNIEPHKSPSSVDWYTSTMDIHGAYGYDQHPHVTSTEARSHRLRVLHWDLATLADLAAGLSSGVISHMAGIHPLSMWRFWSENHCFLWSIFQHAMWLITGGYMNLNIHKLLLSIFMSKYLGPILSYVQWIASSYWGRIYGNLQKEKTVKLLKNHPTKNAHIDQQP